MQEAGGKKSTGDSYIDIDTEIYYFTAFSALICCLKCVRKCVCVCVECACLCECCVMCVMSNE